LLRSRLSALQTAQRMKMQDFDAILERLERNEEIARLFFEIEVEILSAFNFPDLFETLLNGLREKFRIPFVWITLIDEEAAYLIGELTSSDAIKKRLNLLDRKAFLELIGHDTKPLLVNENLRPFYRIFPTHEKYLIRSIALAPIAMGKEIIGSLNFGDSNAHRYSRGMDTSLLERLAVKVSICLSNVMAHVMLRTEKSSNPLRRLLDRQALESLLRRESYRALHYENPVSLIFLDMGAPGKIQGKGVQDGDDRLESLGDELLRICRQSDTVARITPEQFVIALPSTTSDDAQKLAERIESYLKEQSLNTNGSPFTPSFGLGIASTQEPGVQDPTSLLEQAIHRVHMGRQGGKYAVR